MTPKQEICRRLLKTFPKAGSLTLARMAYTEAPSVFTNVEDARSAVRYLRGAKGKTKPTTKEHIRPKQRPGDPFSKLAKGLTHFDDWKSEQLDGPMRVLVLADLHIPYHDKAAVVAALRYGKKQRADTILLNGDIADCFSVSFWEKDPRKRDFAGEVKTVRDFLAAVREGFPKARIIYKIGNHEERYERYMSCKAPELLGLEDFSFEKVFQLEENRIELVKDKRPIRLGKLNVVHGHEFKFGISAPVNPARGYFLRAKSHCLGSHLHQSSQHSEGNVEQKVISTWSTGCLCDLHPDYSPMNSWNVGFAFVEVDKQGAFNVDNVKVIEGRIY